jgi:hypothetical protein
VPEPVERKPPLFLWAYELIHSKRDTLGFWALIKILEIHDFYPAEDSSDDSFDSSGSFGAYGIPGPGPGSSLRSWLVMYHFVGGSSLVGVPWSFLPHHGGDI